MEKFENLKVENVTVDKIKPDPDQPRRTMAEIRALADDIKQHGLHHNIGIDATGIIIFGERRYRAIRMLGWKTISAKRYPSSLTEQERVELQLSENAAREDVPIIEKAQSWMRYIWVNVKNNASLVEKIKQERNGMDVGKYDNLCAAHRSGYLNGSNIGLSRLAEIENITQDQVTRILWLLDTPKPVQEALNAGIIKQSHAIEAMAIKDEKSRNIVLNRLLQESKGLSEEVKRINTEYEREMGRIEQEKQRKQKEKEVMMRKRHEQIQLYEKLRREAAAEKNQQRMRDMAKMKVEEEKRAREEQEQKRQEMRELDHQRAEARKKKQDEERKVQEQKDITQSKQELRAIASIMNHPKTSQRVKEALEIGLIKPSDIEISFVEMDELAQQTALGELILMNKNNAKTINKIAYEKFLKGMNWDRLKRDIDDNQKTARAIMNAITEHLPKATVLLDETEKKEVMQHIINSVKDRNQQHGLVIGAIMRDLIPYLCRLDGKYDYTIEKEEK